MSIKAYGALTGHQRSLYHKALNASYTMEVRVYSYDHNEKVIEELDNRNYAVVGGQVDVDLTQDVSRQLTMDVAPVKGSFAGDVVNGPFGPAKFLGVDYLVLVRHLLNTEDSTWVSTRIFYGTPTLVQWDPANSVTHVEAQSKESLLLPPNLAQATMDLGGRTKDTKMTLTNLVRRLTQDMGETKFALTRTTAKLKFNRARYDAFARQNGAWAYLTNQAHNRNFKLWYDRSGTLKLRHTSKHPVWTFTTQTLHDKQGNVTLLPNVAAVPEVAFDATTYINGVQVYGKLKAKGKKRLLGRAFEPRGAVFDPRGMARHGKPRLMMTTVDDDSVMSRKTATNRANGILKDAQLTGQSSAFTALPVPHLDIYDVVAIRGDLTTVAGGGVQSFIPQQWTIPLTPDLMTVGFNSRYRVISKTRGKQVTTHR